MSVGEKLSDEMEAFIARDDMLPHVTTEAVQDALRDFPLHLSKDRSFEWLAMAVRRALAITIRHIDDNPEERVSNAHIREDIDQGRRLADSARQYLLNQTSPVDDHLWHHAWRTSELQAIDAGHRRHPTNVPSDYLRFQAALKELDWLVEFLGKAGESVEGQSSAWRRTARKDLRVERAYCLAPIFEVAFGEKITVLPVGSDPRFDTLTPFMRFYSEMMSLAFKTLDENGLLGVLRKAQRLHRKHPIQFAAGLIPGLK